MTDGADELRDVEGRGPRDDIHTAQSVARRLASIRHVFLVSLVGFAIGSALVLVFWSAAVSPYLALLVGLGILLAKDARQSRRHGARAAWVVATGGVAVATATVVGGLPEPWQDFLTLAMGFMAGNLAYAYVTSPATTVDPAPPLEG